MVVWMAMLLSASMLLWVISIIILLLTSSLIGFYIVIICSFLILYFLVILYPHEMWWHDNRDYFWSIAFRHLLVITFCIILYAVIYYKYSSFYINWEIQAISFYESLYFSISMWVNLWYSYIMPTKEIALITSLQAINGYLYFAFIISMFAIWFNDVYYSRAQVMRHNKKVFEEHTKEQLKEAYKKVKKQKKSKSKKHKWKQ